MAATRSVSSAANFSASVARCCHRATSSVMAATLSVMAATSAFSERRVPGSRSGGPTSVRQTMKRTRQYRMGGGFLEQGEAKT